MANRGGREASATTRSGAQIRNGNVRMRSLKTLFKKGVNPASGSLVAGSRIRIVHSPKRGIKKYAP